jgi:nicotinamide-nucleotide amidase
MHDLGKMAQSVAAKLKERGETVAITESSGGGLISAALLSIPGASTYFMGGGVIYTHQARRGLLAVPEEAMDGLRSSSEPYARLLATRMREILETTWTVSETGASGPSGNRYGDKPGHTCIAVMGPVERTMTLETGDDDRVANMWVFAQTALDFFEQCVDEAS